MYPWFDAPAADAPMEYYGWVWDPAKREWTPKDEEPVKVEIKLPKFPKPKYPPRTAQALDEPGWYWDGRDGVWKEVTIPKQIEYVKEERPPEPDFYPRPEQGFIEEGWYWNGRAGVWEEAKMPTETKYVERPHPPEPEQVPSRTQPAEVLGWRYSFMYGVWEKIPMPRVPVEVPKKRPPMPEYPPGTAKPYEVLGWSYSVMYEVWEKEDMPVYEIDVTPERGPKPIIEPGVERPTTVEGWSWDETKEEWFATTVYSEPVEFTPTKTLPPGVDEEMIAGLFPNEQQFIEYFDKFMATGMSQVERQRVLQILREEAVRLIKAKKAAMAGYPQTSEQVRAYVELSDKLEAIGVYGALIACAAIVGALVGTIAERLVFPDEDYFRLTGGVTTYLLGPDNWSYSRQIGTSVTGRRYFSSCSDIGTSYVRHFRGYGIGQSDTIDFPGGFVETGYKVPYFVKYTWSHWNLTYVGMLSSAGPLDYVLREGKGFTGEIYRTAEIVPEDEWCPNFRFYL